jgi:hypothetical protein
MNLNENNIKELVDNTFSLDFIEIILTQSVSETPITYSGPGTISLNEDGKLHLKLDHTFVDIKNELFGETGKLIPGKIIGNEHYFSLKAKDIAGHAWVAEGILPGGQISLPAAGRVIESEIRELMQENLDEHASSNKSYLCVLVKGDYGIPANESESLPNGGSWLNTFKMESASYTLKIIQKPGYLTVKMEGNNEYLSSKRCDLLLESLGIVFGRLFTPVYREFANGGTRTVTLFSVPTELSNSNLHAPIPHTRPWHYEPVKEFIENYLKEFTEPWGDLYGFWHQIIHASQGRIENTALSLTVAIEGTIKRYFKEYGFPDEEFKNKIEMALKEIKCLSIDDKIKNRIISSLGQAKISNPKNALFKLAEEGWYEKELADEWVALRNKSTHSDKFNMDRTAFQNFIDKVNKCLLLFYSLIFVIIKYRNTHFDFANEGWPEMPFNKSSDGTGFEM